MVDGSDNVLQSVNILEYFLQNPAYPAFRSYKCKVLVILQLCDKTWWLKRDCVNWHFSYTLCFTRIRSCLPRNLSWMIKMMKLTSLQKKLMEVSIFLVKRMFKDGIHALPHLHCDGNIVQKSVNIGALFKFIKLVTWPPVTSLSN